MTGSAADSSFRCRFCQAVFARQEHLARHIRSHTREKPYSCPQCPKAFSRQDVLNRHLQAHRHPARGTPISTARACTECASARVRCSKDLPCQRCRERGLDALCRYPGTSVTTATGDLPAGDAQPQHLVGSSGNDTSDAASGAGSTEICMLQDNASSSHAVTLAEQPAYSYSESQPPELQPQQLAPAAAYELTFPPGTSNVNSARLDASGTAFLNPAYNYQTFGNAYDGIGSGVNWLSPLFQHDTSWDGTGVPFHTGQIDLNGMPWMAQPSEPAAVAASQPMQWQPTGETRAFAAATPAATEVQTCPPVLVETPSRSVHSTGSTGTRDGTLYVDGEAGRAPFGGRLLLKRQRLSSSASNQHVRGHNTPPDHVVLGSGGSMVSEAAYDRMCLGIVQEVQSSGSAMDMSTLPDLQTVRVSVDLYFGTFHEAYPFVQRPPTCFDSVSGWLLLLAVAATGSEYSDDKGASHVLHETFDKVFTARLCGLNAGAARSSDDELFELQAGLLHLISLVHNSDSQAKQRGLTVLRHQFNEQCRAMRLLSTKVPSVDQARDDGHLVSSWLAAQARIRTGYMIWLFDSMLASESGCATSFRLYDAESPLPCVEAQWEDPSIENITNQSLQAVTISEALEMLYMEKRLPPNLSEFSKVILTYAVCRRMGEAIYQHARSLPSWTPDASVHSRRACDGGQGGPQQESAWPPSNPMIMRWRNSSCDCLDVLHWNANMICAGAGGFEHPTILHLHLSRLLILSPVREMQAAAAVAADSTVSSSRGKDSLTGYQNTNASKRYRTANKTTPFEDALGDIRRWAIIDQFKARLSVVHAGAVLWHVRRYSTDNFIEPFAVYLATLVVWSYSISTLSFARQVAENGASSAQQQHQQQQASREHLDEGRARGRRGEHPPADASSRSSAARLGTSDSPHVQDDRDEQEAGEDEDEDDPQPTFIYLDRPCDDEIVQVYVRTGHRMEGNMVRVGDICKPGAPQKILREGLRMLSGDQSWSAADDLHGGGRIGIRGEFVKKLSALMGATAAW